MKPKPAPLASINETLDNAIHRLQAIGCDKAQALWIAQLAVDRIYGTKNAVDPSKRDK